MYEEIWKGVFDYEDSYEISNLGRIRSVARVIPRSDTGTLVSYPSKVLSVGLDKRGYPRIRLGRDERKTSKRIHRMVAEAFIANPDDKPQVNHKDGDKENNIWTNLEWATNSENQRHAVDTGLKIPITGESAARFERFVDVFKDGGILQP